MEIVQRKRKDLMDIFRHEYYANMKEEKVREIFKEKI